MKHLSRSLATLSLLALFGAGCGSAPASSNATSTAHVPSNVADKSGCLNLYYPLKAGSAIQYNMTGGGVPFTVRVVSHDADSIKLEYTFTVKGKETTITNELVCEDGNIHGKGYFDFASAMSGLDFKYDTVSMKGEIMPNDLAVGKEWTMDTETVVHTDDARLKALMDGTHQKTHIENKVVGEESVTVPAGTFDALKITQTIAIDTGIMNTHVTTTADAWYAKDVGLVKSSTRVNGATSGMEAAKITGQ